MVVAMMKFRWLLPLLLLAGPTGCKVANLPTTIGRDYERVDITMGDDIYTGRILSNREDVEVTKNGILLKPGARFAIKTLEVTEFVGQFDVNILEGQGLTAYIRTVPYRFDSTHALPSATRWMDASFATPTGAPSRWSTTPKPRPEPSACTTKPHGLPFPSTANRFTRTTPTFPGLSM
ncbi:MAG: hypothetical protein UZ07_CHB004002364 [Chlorobi bacterium OLB7]|nr:MAG: hypothetical protein UZ07_CHB004002364 [Chlorobi bacterium OLB7]